MPIISSPPGRTIVRANSGGTDVLRRRLNVIGGTNITVTLADDAPNNEADLTMALTVPVAIANGGTNNSSAYTAGSVIFSNGTTLTQNNANLFWDNTNNRLGIGTVSPGTLLNVNGVGLFGAITRLGSSNLEAVNTGSGAKEVLSLINAQAIAADNAEDIAFRGTTGGNIQGSVRGAWTGTVTDSGGYLAFLTRTNDTAGQTEKVRITNTGNVGIGTTSPQNPLDVEGACVIGATFSGTSAGPTNGLGVEGNTGIGTASPNVASSFASTDKVLSIRAGTDAVSNRFAALELAGTASTTAQDVTYLEFLGNAGATRLVNIVVAQDGATNSGMVKFGTFNAGSFGERMRIDKAGNVIINTAAIATTATDGFLYVPSCAGAPTGTPTTYTGRIPHVVDTTNGRAYWYYGGAWHYATLT